MSKANPALTPALSIARAAAGGPPTKEHKRFQELLAKIDKTRARLQSWQTQAPLFAEQYAQQVKPLEDKLLGERRAWAFELEQRLLAGKWSRADQRVLQRMVCDIAGGLLGGADAPDNELKALFNRYAEVDFDSIEQQQVQDMKALFEATTGIELGDDDDGDDTLSMDELLQRAQAKMAEGARATADDRGFGPRKRRSHKTAAQKQAEADAEKATQTVREVYRKLAAVLHPDRAAPDATDAQRAERHDRMARANAAYEAGDLLALLTLQLQIEQIDVAHAAGVAADQVRHFNRVLAEQLNELEAEVQRSETAFCSGYGLMPERRPDPDKLGPLLRQEVQELLAAEAELNRERRALRGQPADAKRYLKRVAEEQRFEDSMGELPF